MISQTAEYALRAVVFLASQHEPQTTALISESTQVPVGYLAKVMQSLSRAKLVHAQRGINGGFVLAIPATELTVLKVIDTINPIQRFHQCPLGLHGKNLCPLHKKLDDVGRIIEETFGDTTIADLLKGPKDRKPLCRVPGT
jgi:Rrf2 family transcriptional regulator, nitric oxide-sensitive transcriptional repressor